jgi:hypothetical protein
VLSGTKTQKQNKTLHICMHFAADPPFLWEKPNVLRERWTFILGSPLQGGEKRKENLKHKSSPNTKW